MINDRFYVHAPEEPLDETPTRTHKKPKPASGKPGLVRLVRVLVLLLAAFAGLRYLPGLLRAALPGWQARTARTMVPATSIPCAVS